MKLKLVFALVLVGFLSACGPSVVKKYYFNSTTQVEGSEPAPIVSITLYSQLGQPIVVQPAPINITNNISIIVTATVLYTADGKPVTVYVYDPDKEKGHGD